MNTPKLRFKEFSDEWNLYSLGTIGEIVNGLTYSPKDIVTNNSGVLVLRSSNIKSDNIDYRDKVFVNVSKYNPVKENDILICVRNGSKKLIGKNALIKKKDEGNAFGAFMSVFRSPNNKFVHQLFSTKKYYKMIDENLGARINSINNSELVKFKFFFPSLPEQEKIASFFTAIDKKLSLLKEKKEKLETYKKGVMQQIFSQKIRFKDDQGNPFPEWEKFQLGEILTEHKTKNNEQLVNEVFSVAKNKGVINQIEHLGRSYAAENTMNYKVVYPYDIIYTKSPTSGFPFGIIKQNKTNRTGIVSTLYGVFRPQNQYLGFLLDYYFSVWQNTYNYLNPLVQKGAKNTMNINNDTFLAGDVLSLPTDIKEQQKIADFLTALDHKIELVNQEISQTELWKKGLLQQMFV